MFATLSSRRKSGGTPLVELLLLSPVLALVVCGVQEVRRALTVEATLTRAARQVAEFRGDPVTAAAVTRRELSASLGVRESDVQVRVEPLSVPARVSISVPYALVGASLAALLPHAEIEGAVSSPLNQASPET